MISLTLTQQRVLRFIAGHIEAEGRAPSYAEIAAGCGFASKGTAHSCVKRLADRGALTTRTFIELTGKVAIPRAPDGEPLFFVPAPEARP